MAEDQEYQPVGDPPGDWGIFALNAGDPPTGGSGGGGILPTSDAEEDSATESTDGTIEPAPTETNLVGDPPTGGSGGGGLIPPGGGDTSTST